MACTDFQKGITQKLRKGDQSFLCGTHCLDLIRLSINEKLPVLKFQNFGKYNTAFWLLLRSCFWSTEAVWRDKTVTEAGTMVHVMHMHFMFFAVFYEFEIIFRRQHARTFPKHFH